MTWTVDIGYPDNDKMTSTDEKIAEICDRWNSAGLVYGVRHIQVHEVTEEKALDLAVLIAQALGMRTSKDEIRERKMIHEGYAHSGDMVYVNLYKEPIWHWWHLHKYRRDAHSYIGKGKRRNATDQESAGSGTDYFHRREVTKDGD